MRAVAALQVLGIICSCQVIQLMGYDFQLTCIIILVMCVFHYTCSLIEKWIKHISVKFLPAHLFSFSFKDIQGL